MSIDKKSTLQSKFQLSEFDPKDILNQVTSTLDHQMNGSVLCTWLPSTQKPAFVIVDLD